MSECDKILNMFRVSSLTEVFNKNYNFPRENANTNLMDCIIRYEMLKVYNKCKDTNKYVLTTFPLRSNLPKECDESVNLSRELMDVYKKIDMNTFCEKQTEILDKYEKCFNKYDNLGVRLNDR